ncbi:A24 family peptidase [Phenylobacterium sp.]|uniref:A24 family peptidase n=1 Tax=Phenylobacterium sp. TaxID=1871053 RepID=UPI002DEC9AEF|nr:prepilin peptidase [Phenylobacterium sp.]
MMTLNQTAMGLGLSITVAAFAWAAVSDFRRFLIPNRICVFVAGGYLIAMAGMPMNAWLLGLATGGAVLALGTLLFARGLVGGGDVKLASVAALWAGPALISQFALVTGLAGLGIAAVMLSPLRRRMPAAPEGDPTRGLRQPMPFGVALAAGGVWVALLHLQPML